MAKESATKTQSGEPAERNVRRDERGDQAGGGDPFESVRELPHGQFGAGVLGHGAGVDFLFGVGQRERIDVELGGQADEDGDDAQPAQRRGGQRGQGFEAEGVLRGGDGEDGEQKDDVVG